ncbi:HAD-IC family P-type ATPase [Thiohalocapsa marina]|uniref:HAD-IC family P-type ATPase n=1 Tax=Thiohalocapsa marina TaxID=424902 RepID=A0A5M8FLZ8_9GAMM|nr:HAD-IC family P-type ATPase [Thiohalocapsa marina]KAA6185524.1 HAD-IC family P-type ATPase [Thiohalocapsa marina]
MPVHRACRGRARLEVVGLYRSPALKQRLEAALASRAGIAAVQASPVTGRLLVLFGPSLTLEALIQLVEAELDGAGIRVPPTPARAEDSASRRGHGFTWMMSGVAGLLRRLARGRSGWTALAAMAQQVSPAQSLARSPARAPPPRAWSTMTCEQVLAELDTTAETGLAPDEVDRRLQRYGANVLGEAETRSDLAMLLGQFNSLPVALLGVSAGVAVITGGLLDAAVILGVVLINGAIGFVTERQAERTIGSLAQTGVRAVRVLRAGEAVSVRVEQIVPGDVLILAPGDYVAADVRLLRAHRLSIDESALTGESLPVSKAHAFVARNDTALGDRRNMAYMGTHVTGGNGRGVVVATAEATELGQIQTMVGEAASPETPMQRQLGRMGTRLALVSGGVCVGVFGVGVLRGYPWLEMLKASVSLAVAAVPEGLPAVATTTLAMGIKAMGERNVAVRHLDAVETLGAVQVFCMDKTGTLTMNRMAVVALHCEQRHLRVTENRFRDEAGHGVDPVTSEALVRLLQIVSLCSETEVRGVPGQYQYLGTPTENALVELAMEAGVDVRALREERPRLKSRYRAEGRPYMSTLHPYRDGRHLLAVKGSPAEVLAMCSHILTGGGITPLDDARRADILAANQRMAGQALRVLAAAYRELDQAHMPARTEQLVWLGLAGMADPMRPGMDRLIAEYHAAGIETIMITGDQSATAHAIGHQLGLSGDKPLQVLESSRLEEMDPELLAGLVRNVHVFARVSPAHKLRIVRALQEAGLVVAMTGDGINDGPALKAADIGVAMGKTGTNVAREVSDVVLEDDNLHTMTVAVAQGRTIYANIRKMVHFMVSTNLTEIEVMLAGLVVGWGETLNPMQLLWINLVTDIFPGLALSMEPDEPGVMTRPPRDPEASILGGKDLRRMVLESGVIGVGTLGAYLFGLRRYGSGPAAATMAFHTLVLNELAHALSSRSKYRNVFGGERLQSNRHLNRAVLGMAALQVIVGLLPAARRLLGTVPLGWTDLAAIGAGVLLPLMVNEGSKPGCRPARPVDIPEHTA